MRGFITTAFVLHCPLRCAGHNDIIGISSFTSQQKPSRPAKRAKFRAGVISEAHNGVPKDGVPQNGVPQNGVLTAHTAAEKAKISRPLLRFVRLAWKEWRLLVPALLGAVITSSFAIFTPILYGRILSTLALSGNLSPEVATSRLFRRLRDIASVYCLEITGTLIYITLMTRVASKTTRRLREHVFRQAFRNNVGFFDEIGRPRIEEALTREVQTIRSCIWNNLSKDRGIRAFLEVSLGMVACFSVASRVGGPIFGILLPIIASITAQLGLRNGRMESKVAEKESSIKFFVNEKLRGLRTLKVFGAEQYEMNVLQKLLDKTGKSARAYGLSKASTEAMNRVSVYVTIVLLFSYGGMLVCKGVIAFEQFSAMTGYLWLFNFAMQGISFTITDISVLRESLRRIYAVIDGAESYQSLAESSLLPSSQLPSVFNGQVNFNNVHFHYPSRPNVAVLKGITFTIKPGQTVALTGSSGGGKSTIAAMLSRFYVPTQGSVTLDGVDIQSLSRELFADHISLVDQEPVLFQGTIRENIAYGANSDKLSDDAIVQAAKEANAHDFIMQLPQQYDTVWGPGSNLSGGQKQRVAIARSLAKSPQVLLLDEATSALDQESERAVQNALDRIMEHRTVLIIAHRLSTIRSADMILFVQNGEITERGTYDELVARPNGSFRALVEAAANSANRGSEMEMI